jgi:thiamine-phosphate pyrophosphorylase
MLARKPAAARPRIRGLYAVTPDLADTDRMLAYVRAAIAGGAAAVQYRNKSASPALAALQARALADACRDRALFIVNDDVGLALEVGADGVHVGESDVAVSRVRERHGADWLVGVSCYDDLARARAAVAAGASYIAFGSFFPSSVKPAARHADIALLQAARSLPVPVVAIGGITAANAHALVAAGADAVAVISGVFARPDAAAVERAAAAIATLFQPG